jgi:hypothetical protein
MTMPRAARMPVKAKSISGFLPLTISAMARGTRRAALLLR